MQRSLQELQSSRIYAWHIVDVLVRCLPPASELGPVGLAACPFDLLLCVQVLRENNKEHVAITLESSSSLPAPQIPVELPKSKL